MVKIVGKGAIRLQDDDDDGLEPWERCGCAACQATMSILYGYPDPTDDDYRELGYGP